jgi:hypothetical protein
LAGLFLPSLFLQAFLRTRDLEVARRSLYEIRERVGLPPRTAREVEEGGP